MLRDIITIDESKCNGCGACAHACHEGAIEMISGKAHLIREDYCDGFGDKANTRASLFNVALDRKRKLEKSQTFKIVINPYVLFNDNYKYRTVLMNKTKK